MKMNYFMLQKESKSLDGEKIYSTIIFFPKDAVSKVVLSSMIASNLDEGCYSKYNRREGLCIFSGKGEKIAEIKDVAEKVESTKWGYKGNYKGNYIGPNCCYYEIKLSPEISFDNSDIHFALNKAFA